MDVRFARLSEPHIRPLMDLVEGIRSRGHEVPNVDPNDGGVHARALFLLETPGPRAVSSNFISRDNPDPSARNMGFALDQAGFVRADVVLWNVVPYCISSSTMNRNATVAQVRAAVADTQSFVDRLNKLAVAIFCGKSAQRAIGKLRFPDHVRILRTFHPAARSFNRAVYRSHMLATFKEARKLAAQVELLTN